LNDKGENKAVAMKKKMFPPLVPINKTPLLLTITGFFGIFPSSLLSNSKMKKVNEEGQSNPGMEKGHKRESKALIVPWPSPALSSEKEET